MKAAIINLAAEARNLNLDAHDISVIGAAAVRFAVLVELELGLVSKNQVQRAKNLLELLSDGHENTDGLP